MSDPCGMLEVMKQGDHSAANFITQGNRLIEAVSQTVIDQMSVADARHCVELVAKLEQRLSSLKSRCAAQVAVGVQANSSGDAGAGMRAVKNMFSDSALSRREVKQSVAKVEALERMPALKKNLDKVSSSNFTAVASHTSRLSDAQANQLDVSALVKKAKTLEPDRFEKYLRNHIKQATSDPLTEHKAMRAASKVSHWLDSITGMGHIHAELDPERYERIANRIDREVNRLANLDKRNSGETKNATKDSRLAADAFCSLLGAGQGKVAAGQSKTGGRSSRSAGDKNSSCECRPTPTADLLVVVDHKTLKSGRHTGSIAETESGVALSEQTVNRLACDAIIRKVETDGKGLVLNVGRKQRVASDAQWAGTKAMYSTCSWSGCETRIQHCQLHHIQYWRNGGKTDMSNLVPLCSHHHHKVHEGGWSLKLKPDRSLEHIKPDKSVWKTTKPPNRLDSG